MTRHNRCNQPLAEHALGQLPPDEAARVDAHIAECAACRVEFDELVAAVAAVDIAAAPAAALEPHSASRDSLLAAARATPQERPEPLTAQPVPAPSRWLRMHQIALAVAAVSLMGMFLTLGTRDEQISSLERRLDDAKGEQIAVLRGATVSTLDTAGPFGDARAQVVLQKGAGVVAFRRVPAPPAERVWQVWIVTSDDKITSLGIIDTARKAAFLPIEKVKASKVERFIVTAEPIGGSEGPTAEEQVAEGTV